MPMRKAACLAVLIFFLVACAPQPEKPLTIGVSLTLTGAAAATGKWMQNGIELALERLPPEERANIQVMFEDDQCDPKLGMTIAQKFTEVEGVKFMIGPLCGSVVNPTMDYYEQNKVLRMVQGWGLRSYEGRGEYYVVPLGHVRELMRHLAQHVASQGITEMAIIFRDDEYGRENMEFFEQFYNAQGGKIVAKEPYAAGETDFRTQLTKLKATDAEGLFIAARGSDLVNVHKQMDELKFTTKKFGMYNTQDPDVLKAVGNLTESMIYPHIRPAPTEIRQWYVQRYTEKHGVPPEAISATTFDSFMILLDAIKACDQDVECVRGKVMTVTAYPGAGGIFSIDENGFGIRQTAIKMVKDGKFVFVEE